MDQQQVRLWLAIVLSMVVWLAYDHYVLGPAREATQNQTEVAEQVPAAMPDPALPQAGVAPAGDAAGDAAGPERLDASPMDGLRAKPSGNPITVETPLYQAVLTPRGGRLLSFELRRYRTSVDEQSPPLELVDQAEGAILPMSAWIGSARHDVEIEYAPNQTTFVLSGDETAELTLTGTMPDGGSIEKRITFDAASYLLGVDIRVSGGRAPSSISLIVPKIADTGGYSAYGDHAVAIADGRLIEHAVDDMKEKPARDDGVDWAGFSGTYFASVGVPVGGKATAVFASAGPDPIVRLDTPSRDGAASYLVLLGPKDRDLLEGYGREFERLIDFGWFWFIASPMLWLLHRIHDVVRNYGIAIIVITLILKVVTFPLNQTSMKSMRKMQEIQPHLQRLRERHKEDPSAMQREMMELYKKHNVNPFSGCLPMLIQIPVFIALYNGLLRDIALRHAPFVGWINDLSAPDRLHLAGVGIPVLTLLMGASMLLQQVTAPMQGDPTQRRMMMIMPVVFTFMFINFPSGLVLYWLVNNVVSIGQQYLAMRPTT